MGDRVQVIAGPFEGRDGVVVSVVAGDGDAGIGVEVAIEVFQRLGRVNVGGAEGLRLA